MGSAQEGAATMRSFDSIRARTNAEASFHDWSTGTSTRIQASARSSSEATAATKTQSHAAALHFRPALATPGRCYQGEAYSAASHTNSNVQPRSVGDTGGSCDGLRMAVI